MTKILYTSNLGTSFLPSKYTHLVLTPCQSDRAVKMTLQVVNGQSIYYSIAESQEGQLLIPTTQLSLVLTQPDIDNSQKDISKALREIRGKNQRECGRELVYEYPITALEQIPDLIKELRIRKGLLVVPNNERAISLNEILRENRLGRLDILELRIV